MKLQFDASSQRAPKVPLYHHRANTSVQATEHIYGENSTPYPVINPDARIFNFLSFIPLEA
jgi:hypothetical protein